MPYRRKTSSSLSQGAHRRKAGVVGSLTAGTLALGVTAALLMMGLGTGEVWADAPSAEQIVSLFDASLDD